MTKEEIHQCLLDYYRHYIMDSDSFEYFSDRVNTLGGTFLDGWIKHHTSSRYRQRQGLERNRVLPTQRTLRCPQR